jgi:hypothetical protein
MTSSSGLALRLIEIGDRDAAHDQLRATLTSAARAVLLQQGEFALARSELPGQLRFIRANELADALEASIYGEPDLEELCRTLDAVHAYEVVAAGQSLMGEDHVRLARAARLAGRDLRPSGPDMTGASPERCLRSPRGLPR